MKKPKKKSKPFHAMSFLPDHMMQKMSDAKLYSTFTHN